MLFQTTRRLLTGTYIALFSNIGMALRICAGWLLFKYLLYFYLGIGEIDTWGFLFDKSFWLSDKEIILLVLFNLTPFVYIPSIAVAWIRGLMLGEKPWVIHLRFGLRELKFIGWTFVLYISWLVFFIISGFVILIIPGFFLQSVFGNASFLALFVEGVLLLIFGLFALSPAASLSLVLSAVACDEHLPVGKVFDTVWSLGAPMVLAGVAATLPVMVLTGFYSFLFGFPVTGYPGGILGLFVVEGLNLVAVILASGILTGGYYILRERQMPSGGGPQVPKD
ncbi:hypothetical protein [Stappia sp.]|uniref:hypothetical protein n=1 Tax=Stappia sp. TaxID=1870903 RepID=UPI003C7E0022